MVLKVQVLLPTSTTNTSFEKVEKQVDVSMLSLPHSPWHSVTMCHLH